MDPSDLNFTVAAAAALAGVKPDTARAWFQRGVLVLDLHDVKAPAGGSRKLSWRTLVQLAITGHLTQTWRTPPAEAAKAAAFFAGADQHFFWCEASSENERFVRQPGALFPADRFGRTLMILRPGEFPVIRAQNQATNFLTTANGRVASAIVVDCNAIVEALLAAIAQRQNKPAGDAG